MKNNKPQREIVCTCVWNEIAECRHRFTCDRNTKAVIVHPDKKQEPKVKGFSHVPKQPVYPYK